MYSIMFEKAFKDTIGLEGGYSNDPLDVGGETKYGISSRTYATEDIKNLTLDRAKFLYYRDFWSKLRLDDLRGDIAGEIFDTAVNMGQSVATEFAQRTCNYLGSKLVEDGKMGPLTIQALRNYPYPIDILKILNALQLSRYVTIVQENPSQKRFAKGWLKRIQVIPT